LLPGGSGSHSIHFPLATQHSAVAVSKSFQSSGKFLVERMSVQTKHFYAFGPFRFDSNERVLVRDGTPVPLAPKATEILLVLVEHAGHLVDKDALINRVWPDAFVEEGNLNKNVFFLRKALGEWDGGREYIETVPKRGYRFIAPITEVTHPEVAPQRRSTETTDPARESIQWRAITGATLLVVALSVGGWLLHSRKAHALTAKDTIVLGDFTNMTGEAVLDGTLRQGLSVQLEQSPFLSIVSDQQIQQTLKMMSQNPDVKLTAQTTQEICQRTGSAAALEGSIARIGTQYLLTLKAVNCKSGESLASAEAEASDKNHVLDALRKAALGIRGKLGESLNAVRKFDTPIELATTPSLGALQAYSRGRKAMAESDFAAAVPLFQRAVSLDPNFAVAHSSLGNAYWSLGQTNLGAQSVKKAYELRERVSDREKFYIECNYHWATGDLEKARRAYELWAQVYPRDDVPLGYLSAIDTQIGNHEKALAEAQEALRRDPMSAVNYANLAFSYLNLNRLDKAKAIADQAQAKNLDSQSLRASLYQLAFLQNDAQGMATQVAWGTGKPAVEDVLLASEANTAAYFGRLAQAREFSRRAVASAEREEEKETAAGYEAEVALWEAVFGNAADGRRRALAALDLSSGRDVQYGAALALAFTGDAGRAQALADDLGKRFPEDSLVKFKFLPTIHSQIAINRNDYSKAIRTLQVTAPYELGISAGGAFSPTLYPVYVRAKAYLDAHRGNEAAAEFQKILDQRAVVQNEAIGALAHLGLARAYVLQGDTAKANVAYQDFLGLWKDADPEIPILQQAKTEYAKLQ
jgi:DNA-binding winged helix-turn-helix (wHTH) protein/tetratricopeptide (TPR) repeat protein